MTDDLRKCCNHDCDQGDECPLRSTPPWWAEILVVLAYLLVAVATVALVIYGGSKLAGYLLTLYPIPR